MAGLIYEEITYILNGILFAVHNERGRFCSERQYCDAIEQKLKEQGIRYVREFTAPAAFAGEAEGRNKIDFFIEDKIVLEVKAKNFIGRPEYYQVRRYLEALGKKLGLLVNFQARNIRVKRILNSGVGV